MWIKGARIVDPGQRLDFIGDIHIESGRIKAVEKTSNSGISHGEVIDARGLWVFPGIIDMHAHLREPGYEYKEDIYTGSLAAAAGGITTVVCMANTDPVNDNPSVTKYILEKAEDAGLVRVLPVGAVTRGQAGRDLSEMGLMKRAGIVAVSDDGMPVEDASIMRRALEYAATFNLLLISHCEDKKLSETGVMNEGALSSELGLPGIPTAAEEVMVARDTIISLYTACPVHITHVSTQGSLDIIRDAKAKGIKVSCDVTPHHLLLDETRLSDYDTNAKMYPPLRSNKDRKALIQGLASGVIDVIASDHAPHAKDEKDLDFDIAPFGAIGLQTLLPSVLRLHFDYGLDLMHLLSMVTINPARLLGIEGGTLRPGYRADITIVDPLANWTLTEDVIRSKSKNSPFLGETFKGEVVYTISCGRIVYRKQGF